MKLKTNPSFPSSSGNRLISSSLMPVVSQLNDGDKLYASILSGYSALDCVRELPGFVQVRGLGFHPQHVREGRHSQRFGDGIIDPALDLIETFWGLGQLAIPDNLNTHRLRPRARLVEGSALRERLPFLHAHVEMIAFVHA